jgi:Domain of unknown function (DUF1835)
MLHVTNGSVFLSRLHDLGVPGTIIPWDDVLHEGPVPAGLSPNELRRRRAEFLAINWGDVADIERGLASRDQAVADAASADEIVLWFEHDLYDQLHVLQVVDLLHTLRARGALAARVTAILADDYLAAQPDDRLGQWFAARVIVSEAQFAAAAAAWEAFRAPAPVALQQFQHPGAWPTLTKALRRHLQQFPAVGTGLSRTERQTLAAAVAGPRPLRELFHAANHECEDAIFMGDAGWWLHIRPLLTGAQPLLASAGDRPDDWHHEDWWRADEGAPKLRLTEAGARVLTGDADHVDLNGIDRWLGGVHLIAEPVHGVRFPVSAGNEQVSPITATPVTMWRWNEERGTIERG